MLNRIRVVVDTNIWDFAFLDCDNVENAESLKKDCSRVLFALSRKNDMAFAVDFRDGNSFILSEYRHKLSGIRDFEVFLLELWKRTKIVYVEPIPDGTHDVKLVSLGFHEVEDHVFVNTALAADKVIITEDGDYGVHGEVDKKEVYSYLTEDLGIQLLHAYEFYRTKISLGEQAVSNEYL